MRSCERPTGPARRGLTSVYVPVTALLLASCLSERATGPDAPVAAVSPAILDAAHGGRPGFFWLPPLVPAAHPDGTFDPAVPSIEVRVCVLAGDACAGEVVAFSGATTPALVVDVGAENYQVLWHTKGYGLDPARTYRMVVTSGPVVLGSADLDVVARAQELKGVAGSFVPVVKDHPLNIKFRVETGIVAALKVTPGTAVILEGETQAFAAALTDLHGDPVTDAPIAWTSSDAAVASPAGTTGASVTVHGVAAGVATITATSRGATGTAVLTVESPSGDAVTSGQNHSCALTVTGAAYCWGDNNYGELGTGGPYGVSSATPLPVAGGLTFKQIDAGDVHTCGLTTDGAAYCWGGNPTGGAGDQLGWQGPAAPTLQLGGHVFEQITAGYLHTCALTAEGKAYCWGFNSNGELGIGSTDSWYPHPTPLPVSGNLTFKQISAGGSHTCAVTTDGVAYCWGSASKVGDGGPDWPNRSAPSPVAGGLVFREVSAGTHHTCGLTTAGTAYCWGNNMAGALGDPELAAWGTYNTPMPVSGGHTFRRISAGYAYGCGLTAAGSVLCWGAYLWLGDGSTSHRATPAPIATSQVFRSLGGGDWHQACAITAAGTGYCWGPAANSLVPTPVPGGLVLK